MQADSPDLPDQLRLPEPAGIAREEVRWRFGSFTLWESQRRLEAFGQGVRLGPRSFDLLLQLVTRAGELISKEELLSTVWTGVVVEEASVRVHMSLLRKALGEPGDGDDWKEWITNVPLRGYRFNGRVIRELVDNSAEAGLELAAPFTPLPARLSELIGRESDIEGILASMESHRLVTIIGPGGIGKTSVAIRAAERSQHKSGADVAFVDLSPLISPDHVLGTLARSVGIAADLPDPLQAMAHCMTGRAMLLVIDNCEHVLDSLALPIIRLLGALPDLKILATSREMLRISGEKVIRLPALAVPDTQDLTITQAMQWPSVELLVERAKAAGAGAFNDAHSSPLIKISRQLEGMPLAIELVAARLGVEAAGDLAHRLHDHMRLLSIGNRAASDRHRTLAAALDWSVALLGEQELRIFRRLSVFRGRFDLESALGVTVGELDPDVAFDALIALTQKSLVFYDANDPVAPYRLLAATRSYAASLLAESGEQSRFLRSHATFMLDLMKAATAELPNLTGQAWGDRYSHHLDDVRFALENCLADPADAKTAAALVTASAALWFHVSEVAEYRERVETALKLVEGQAEPDVETETWLLTALVIALLHADGLGPELDATCERALAGALSVKSRVLELQARWGLTTNQMFRGDYSAALQQSETLLEIARSWADPAALNLAHRVCAMANHFCGNFEPSRLHCEMSLHLSKGAPRTRTNMVGVDPTIAAQAMLSRTLWIEGESSKALETAAEAVGRAESTGHVVSLCAALFGACPVALWSGQIELADRWIRLMLGEAQRRGLVGWLRHAKWYFQALQLSTAQNPALHIREIADQFSGYESPRKEMLVTFCEDWVDDDMVARIASGEALWSAAEVWRALGRRSESRGVTQEAEGFYRRALETSRQQGAKAWELRAGLSLANLWVGLGRLQEAAQLLDLTCDRLPEDKDPGVVQVRNLREEIAVRLGPIDRRLP